MVAASLLYFPVMRIRERMEWHQLMSVDFPILLFGSGSVLAFYLLSQKELRARWGATLWDLPCLMSVGMGLCVNNSQAVLEALWGRKTEFVRTPKLDVKSGAAASAFKDYRGRLSPLVLLELGAALYFVFVLVYAMRKGIYVSLPFVLLFLSGYLYSSIRSLGEAVLPRR
jgi:hypothetical protein